ncbi:ATP-binding cassette domain-containing protein [uncultured Thalassospira sp.]|uniref:iron ABC transporter ATP-binding protein n=1 Tax=uncultured Thalassospira sp. TaxID=404382 RepID=UPI00258B0B72|nr:ATP-binding cassette domain-containing protein [uncultured Thalassospira sp.]
MINVRNATKSYDGTLVVDDVTLGLKRNGLTSIIGPNGAGKSTLLSMIARLVNMDDGKITVDGVDIATADSLELAKRLAVLRQDNHITARLTVRDLVAFGRYPHSKGRTNENDLEHVNRALAYLGLTDLSGRFLDQLSGGQRQRAFVAMTLCQDTDYMLFDEPLNNLDIHHAVSMMKLFRQAARDFGKTVVVVIHDINFASCYSDHIIAMKDGKVAEQGSPDQIIDAGILTDIYNTSFQVQNINGQMIATYYGI